LTDLPVQHLLLEAVRAIESVGIQYAIMGGVAARAWGLPRPTYDADIAVLVDGPALAGLLEALDDAGFDVPAEHRGGLLDTIGTFHKAKVTQFADGHVWSTDLFLVEGPFLRSALDRARVARIGGRDVRVMAPEDIILLKLIAARRKDLADIEEILLACASIDVGYLRSWASALRVADRLAEFLPLSEP